MKKILIWIFVLIVLSSFGYATGENIYAEHNVTGWLTWSASGGAVGMEFLPLYEQNLTNAIRVSGCTCTTAYLHNVTSPSTSTLLSTSTGLSGDNFTFTPYTLLPNNHYVVICDAGGPNYDQKYVTTTIWVNPLYNTSINWTYGWNGGHQNASYNILGITTVNITAGGSPTAANGNFTIFANNTKTDSLISGFNATIGGTTYTTTTDTLITDILNNDTTLYNITVFIGDEFQNYSVTEWNVSSNLTAQMVPYFHINATNFYNGTSINTFNATISGTTYTTTSGQLFTDIPFNSSSLYNITIESTDYDQRNYTNQNVSTDLLALLYYYYNFSDYTFTNPVIEMYSQTMTLTLNKSQAQVTDVVATLTYNNVSQTVTETDYGNYIVFSSTFNTPQVVSSTNLTFYWNYTVVRDSGNATDSVLDNQTVISIGIDNCSTYTTQAINFSLYNESSGTFITTNGTMAGYFQIWVADINDFVPFNLTWENSNTYGLCYDPASAAMSLYGQLEYTAPGFATETYYFENAEINNVTEYIILYLTDDTTLITFNVIDENDDPVVGAYIHVLTYDIPTDSFVTTEILQTGYGGTAVGNLIQNTQDYMFLISYNNETVLETASFKILLTEYTFVVNLGSDYFENYNVVRDIAGSVTYTNATRTFSYTFTNPTGLPVEGCLEITQRGINADTQINETCVTSASGTIDIVLPTSPTGMYLGVGSVTYEGQYYIIDVAEANFDTTYKTFGLEGLFVSFLLIVFVVMAGLWHPAAAIVLTMIGCVITIALDIFHLRWLALVTLLILGGIAVYRSRNQ